MSQSMFNDHLQNSSERMKGICQEMSNAVDNNKNDEIYQNLFRANQLISNMYNNQETRSSQPNDQIYSNNR